MSLHSLFRAMANAQTETALRHSVMDNLSQSFGVQRWGIYIGDSEGNLVNCDVRGVNDNFVEKYQKFGKSIDPVLKYVAQYHAPAHEELVLPLGAWKQSELYRRCCVEGNHEHIITGPIISRGNLIGTINMARVGTTQSFNSIDLSNLSAVCLHLSTCLANLHCAQLQFNTIEELLTPREIEIARLVAQGLTNKEIGRELWIGHNTVKQALKKMFRKLNVTSRTKMIVKLVSLGLNEVTIYFT